MFPTTHLISVFNIESILSLETFTTTAAIYFETFCRVQSINHFKRVLLISDFEIKKNLNSSNCIVSSRRHSPMFSPESDHHFFVLPSLSHYYDYIKLDKNFLNSASVPARPVSVSAAHLTHRNSGTVHTGENSDYTQGIIK